MKVGRRGFLQIAIGVVIAILTVAALASGLRLHRVRVRVAALEAAGRQLSAQTVELATRAEALRAHLEKLQSAEPNAPRQPVAKPGTSDEADLLQRISSLESSVKNAAASLADLQLRSHRLEDKLAETGGETKKLTDLAADLNQRLSNANNVVQAMESELRGKQSRLVPLELSARNLHSSREAALDSIDRQLAPARAIEELQRRRETYLSSLLGRYRQLVDQSGLQSFQPANPAGANPATYLDVSRVHSVVSQAEEDQRQIQALDAQAQLVLDRMQKLH